MIHEIRWTVEKIAQRLTLIGPSVYRRRQPLPPFRYAELGDPLDAPPVDPQLDDSDWPLVEPYTYWGRWRTDFTLRGTFEVPDDWDTGAPIALYLPLGDAGDFSHPEALAYIDGAPYAACDRHHQEFRLPERFCDGKPHALALHGWTGLGGGMGGEHNTRLFMRPCAVVQIDQPTRDFIATARVALGIARSLDENNPARGRLLSALDEAFKIVDIREPLGERIDDSAPPTRAALRTGRYQAPTRVEMEPFGELFYDSIPEAHAALRAAIERAGPPLDIDIFATGHAHIDVAWLWTLGQTRRKAGRTFHTVLRLMEQFPDYHFTQSQPQLYDYVRQDYPALFEAIKQRVADGRWDPTGGMWVEADCNLSGPESLARQFLLGRSFFRAHFGPDVGSPVLWLPDVFGYAWALPQLIKEAGLEYFFTIKIGWSQYNRLPYDSFWWQGLDGTRVLTHFSTTPETGSLYASTYNANATPQQTIGTWTNFKQKDLTSDGANPPLLMAFGYGDGGGGPTREMLENIREMAEFPATPRMRKSSPGEFFRDLEQRAGDQLPVWNGELYLEYHRGTYTTQSRNKRANRKSEFLLHDAEFLATLAAQLDPSYAYPADALRKAWELVCLNQFHDIIPGTSINPVYVESQQQYAEVQGAAMGVRDAALERIAAHVGGDLLVANPTGQSRSDLAFWPGQLKDGQILRDASGPLATQATADGTLVAFGRELAPYSVTALTLAQGAAPQPESSLTATPARLENDLLLVELNGDGDITRIYDKVREREVLPSGAIANQFQAFEDRPMRWDAWDIDIFYDDKCWLAEPAESVQVIEQGPLRSTIEVRRRILGSRYVQRISLSHDSARLDFDTWIDWRERHIMLKVAFPVEVLTPTATYEIQWGNVQRPTHRNTSWDWARFETCAQKWVDLSEGDYGVSLLNDCKYGHDVRDNVMRISLLRSPTHPDPEADQGEHRFVYSLLPHDGSWGEETIAAAYALNDPLIVAGSATPASAAKRTLAPFVAADQPNIVIETVKRAEDGRGVIVRFYESQRRRGPVTLRAGFGLAGASRANIMEEDREDLEVHENQVTLQVRPYEIVTLRLLPA